MEDLEALQRIPMKKERKHKKDKQRREKNKRKLAAERLVVRKGQKQEDEINKKLDLIGEPETIKIEEDW